MAMVHVIVIPIMFISTTLRKNNIARIPVPAHLATIRVPVLHAIINMRVQVADVVPVGLKRLAVVVLVRQIILIIHTITPRHAPMVCLICRNVCHLNPVVIVTSVNIFVIMLMVTSRIRC